MDSSQYISNSFKSFSPSVVMRPVFPPRTPKSLRFIFHSALSLVVILWLRSWQNWIGYEWNYSEHPRLQQTIFEGTGIGGRWHIPSTWIEQAGELPNDLTTSPKTTLEAAHLAFYLARSQDRYITNSTIPLILHQSWHSMTPQSWSPLLKNYVESWLAVCDGEQPNHDDGNLDEMAYIMWDNIGIDLFIEQYESDFWQSYISMPIQVERVDAFRVAVLRWFGGVYSDVDTMPLRHPVTWIEPIDCEPWEDEAENSTYSLSSVSDGPIYSPPSSASPLYLNLYEMSANGSLRVGKSPAVGAIVGIEADIAPETDAYWRAGYQYPLQITQWSLALAPHHPISTRFIASVDMDVKTLQREDRLLDAYAVDLTGPVQFTKVIKEWLELVAGLRWNALTGMHDDGKSKTVADVLVLPITGFSPGRASLANRGSKPITDHSARLLHQFQGSWRGSFDLVTEYGKMCRTLFGKCRSWSKDSSASKKAKKTKKSWS
ncbi:hypothetical protein V1519DRAFT_455535 [Lipomyces tetrasporus]